MTPLDVVRGLLDSIQFSGKEYLVVGAFAVGAWGMVRATQDADFVLAMTGADLDRVFAALPPGVTVDPQALMEAFTGTIRWVLRIEKAIFKIELFILGNDAHHRAMFGRKVEKMIPVLDRLACIPTAEDLIIQKLRWARTKDVADVESVLGVQAGKLDYAYIESWCEKHGTLEHFHKALATVPSGI